MKTHFKSKQFHSGSGLSIIKKAPYMRLNKQQRINNLAWELIDLICPPNRALNPIKDLEKGLVIAIEQYKSLPKAKDRELKSNDEIDDLIDRLEKEKRDYLWVGENPETEELEIMDAKNNATWGSDMSFAYNLALDRIITYLKSRQAAELKDEKQKSRGK